MRTSFLDRLWYGHHPMMALLVPVSLLFGSMVVLRRWLYRMQWLRPTRLPVPVVVVGNITVGGTGKTPLTIALARALQSRGLSIGIVCRSYAARACAPGAVSAESDPAAFGDEAVLLAACVRAPVWSGPSRIETARALLEAHETCELLLLDDGLQHYALERDFEIAVIDAARQLGNGWLLPAGPLREPASRLREVDAIVLNGAEGSEARAGVPSFPMVLTGDRFTSVCIPRADVDAARFAGQRVAAIAGIGHPERFFAHLRALGLAFEPHSFPDHHAYRAEDLAFPHFDAIVMTEKDAIKCRGFGDSRLWALPVHARVPGTLAEMIETRVKSRLGHRR